MPILLAVGCVVLCDLVLMVVIVRDKLRVAVSFGPLHVFGVISLLAGLAMRSLLQDYVRLLHPLVDDDTDLSAKSGGHT